MISRASQCFGSVTTLNFLRRYSNNPFKNGLVKIYTISSIFGIKYNLTSPSTTFSFKKSYRIAIYFVQECITSLFEILIALILSYKIEIKSLKFIQSFFIHITYVQHDFATIVYAFAMDKKIDWTIFYYIMPLNCH